MDKVKRIWFPEQHQIVISQEGSNAPYLHSVWVGITAPVMNLPVIVWHSIIKPALMGLLFVVRYTWYCVAAGLMGRAQGLNIAMPQVEIQYRVTEKVERDED